ncbi:MAG: YbjN domain-containing protein [Bacteroidales bacterium]
MELETYFGMVENCIKNLGVDPAVCRLEKAGQWDLKKGSASVWIDVFKSETNNFAGYFQCMAPVVQVPTSMTKEFYEEILEKNHSLYAVSLVKYKDWIYIKTIRELEGIDQNEMFALITRVGNYADDLDDYYNNKYHGGGFNSPKSV